MSYRKQKSVGWQHLMNFFGGLGYIGTLFEWLWAFIVYIPLLVENRLIRSFLMPSQSDNPSSAFTPPQEFSGIIVVFAVIVTVIVFTVSIMLLLRLPLKIIRTGHDVAKTTATRTIMPIITHHKPVPARKRRVLTARIIGWLKLGSVSLPLGIFFSIYLFDEQLFQLPRELIVFVGASIALIALLCFVLQYLVAIWRKLPGDTIL